MLKIIKGYKALSPDMRAIMGDGMQYELGEKYALTGDVIPCVNGYHFCKTIEDLNAYYSIHESRIFEIEASGTIETDDNIKFASKKIKLVREISQQEIKEYFKSNYKEFIQSKYGWVRKAIANQGLGLDILIKDECYDVRLAVANQGYGLDILIKDEYPNVRVAIARQGYGLNILINDKYPLVRAEVANQGYGLETLVNDEFFYVREVVARQGYGLDVLINDTDLYVRKIAQSKLEELNY